MGTVTAPVVGTDIYIESAIYMSHGEDDRVGGLARVSSVYKSMSGGEMVDFVTVVEIPGTAFNWGQCLYKLQEKLKKKFRNNRAYPDPDYTPYDEEPGW